MSTAGSHRVYDKVKRLLDFCGAIVLLVVTFPIQLVVGLLVAVKLGRPVLFQQERPGFHGEVFTLLKFRSMRDVNIELGMVSDADRLTPFGKVLRATSLDELPSLWNVVRGEMSFVGPRPLLVEYLPLYNSEQALRHQSRPGLTGLAQVSGRNGLSWDEKLELDVHYVANRSMLLDVKILFRTIRIVLTGSGVSSPGEATTTKFTGASND